MATRNATAIQQSVSRISELKALLNLYSKNGRMPGRKYTWALTGAGVGGAMGTVAAGAPGAAVGAMLGSMTGYTFSNSNRRMYKSVKRDLEREQKRLARLRSRS